MRIIKWIAGGVFTLSLIVILLLTSFEIAVYSDLDFFEKEYTKYSVAEDVKMEMADLLLVSDEMMKYLRDDREDLIIKTRINGNEEYFFNDREISHMEDVKNLFSAGFAIRKLCVALVLICVLLLMLTKVNWLYVLSHSLKVGITVFAALAAVLSIIVAIDFNKAFTIFHELFFTNDLWLLDPATDRLINILPEGFFIDTVIRIGVIFGVFIILVLVLAIIIEHKERKEEVGRGSL